MYKLLLVATTSVLSTTAWANAEEAQVVADSQLIQQNGLEESETNHSIGQVTGVSQLRDVTAY